MRNDLLRFTRKILSPTIWKRWKKTAKISIVYYYKYLFLGIGRYYVLGVYGLGIVFYLSEIIEISNKLNMRAKCTRIKWYTAYKI